jgi:hypothetical protein
MRSVFWPSASPLISSPLVVPSWLGCRLCRSIQRRHPRCVGAAVWFGSVLVLEGRTLRWPSRHRSRRVDARGRKAPLGATDRSASWLPIPWPCPPCGLGRTPPHGPWLPCGSNGRDGHPAFPAVWRRPGRYPGTAVTGFGMPRSGPKGSEHGTENLHRHLRSKLDGGGSGLGIERRGIDREGRSDSQVDSQAGRTMWPSVDVGGTRQRSDQHLSTSLDERGTAGEDWGLDGRAPQSPWQGGGRVAALHVTLRGQCESVAGSG